MKKFRKQKIEEEIKVKKIKFRKSKVEKVQIFFFENFLTHNFEKYFTIFLLYFRWYASHSFQYQSLYSTLCENPRKPTCDFRRVALDHPIGN